MASKKHPSTTRKLQLELVLASRGYAEVGYIECVKKMKAIETSLESLMSEDVFPHIRSQVAQDVLVASIRTRMPVDVVNENFRAILDLGFSTIVQEANVYIEVALYYSDSGQSDKAIELLTAFRKTFEIPRPVKELLKPLNCVLPKKRVTQYLSLIDEVVDRIKDGPPRGARA